jgi:DNA-binding MarR family transcriptional regulator
MTGLTDAQQHAWRELVMATHLLDEALDRQSQRDGGMPHAYYKLLVLLFESPGHGQTMSGLAAQLRYSLSRLTHAVTSMEKSGWLLRSRSTEDRRVQTVALTDAGVTLVRRVSPLQAAEVRSRVFSRLSGEQVEQLAAIGSAIIQGLDAGEEELDDVALDD